MCIYIYIYIYSKYTYIYICILCHVTSRAPAATIRQQRDSDKMLLHRVQLRTNWQPGGAYIHVYIYIYMYIERER